MGALSIISTPLLAAFVFFAGSSIGSFLNVCIHRIPLGMSIVQPGSRCPRCGFALRWYHNLPLLSYALLRGRCAHCGAGISARYPLVEALTGGLFVLCLFRFGPGIPAAVYALLLSMLVAVTFIDLDHQIIPDVISLPGIVLGFLASFAVPWLSWHDSLIGILLGGGLLLVIAYGFEKLAGKEGMGGGDIKLLAMIGAFLGWKAILPVLFLSSVIGLLMSLPLVVIRGTAKIPFGPFLSVAAAIWLFAGEDLLRIYMNLMFHQ